MKKCRLAIVGATGIVGRTVLKVLEEKDFKIGDKIEAVIENGMILLMKTTKEEELKNSETLEEILKREGLTIDDLQNYN